MCVCGRAFPSRPIRGADAVCISDALVDFGSEVERERKRWTVQVTAPSAPEVTVVLAALKNCLDEYAIALADDVRM
jgi:hypothetical protein